MNQADVEAFTAELENVQREEAFGYVFFYVGDDNRRPFATIANSDQEFDNVSNLARDGVFRINIGVSRETFQSLVSDLASKPLDYSVLNTFLPHPEYSKQHFICILNPSGANVEATQQMLLEAHAIATARLRRPT